MNILFVIVDFSLQISSLLFSAIFASPPLFSSSDGKKQHRQKATKTPVFRTFLMLPPHLTTGRKIKIMHLHNSFNNKVLRKVIHSFHRLFNNSVKSFFPLYQAAFPPSFISESEMSPPFSVHFTLYIMPLFSPFFARITAFVTIKPKFCRTEIFSVKKASRRP